MTPKQARAARKEAIIEHCTAILDTHWPNPGEDALRRSKESADKLRAAINEWVEYSKGGPRPDPNMLFVVAHEYRAHSQAQKTLTVRKNALKSISRIVESFRPRKSTFGLRFPLPPIELSYDNVKATASGLWVMVDIAAMKITVVCREEIPKHRCGFWHPHVDIHGNPCMGSVASYYKDALKDGRVMDAIDLMVDALDHYNPDSPYIKLSEFRGVECTKCKNTTRTLLVAYRMTESGTESVRLCSDCILSCRTCGAAWEAGTDISSGCPRCTKLCVACGQYSPNSLVFSTYCARCGFFCNGCHRYLPTRVAWFLSPSGNIRCARCADLSPTGPFIPIDLAGLLENRVSVSSGSSDMTALYVAEVENARNETIRTQAATTTFRNM